jgi:predicted PurR-regulated permease PerM
MARWSWLRRWFVAVPAPGADPAGMSSEGTATRPGPAETAEASTPAQTGHIRWIALEQRTFRRSVVFVLVAVTLWMWALWVFQATAHFLFLLLLAWLIAIAMEPPIRWLVRHHLSRILATTITGIGAIIVFLGVGAIFANELAKQISQLVTAWPSMVSTGVHWLDQTFHVSVDAEKITSAIDLTKLSDLGSNLAQGAFGVLGTIGSLTFDLLTVIVFAFYFAAGAPSLIRHLASWLPPDQQEIFATVWETSTAKTGGYVISKLVLIFLSTFFHGIFFFAIGLPGWLALALLTGITAQLIPMIGTYIGIIAAVLVAISTHPLNALWVIAFATVYQQVENYVFTPRVSKRVMDVSAPLALAAIFVGVAIFGPIGALIGIPLVAAIAALLETYGHRYELVSQIADIAEVIPPSETPPLDDTP